MPSGYLPILTASVNFTGALDWSTVPGLTIPAQTGYEIAIIFCNAGQTLGANVYLTPNGSSDTTSASYWASGTTGISKSPLPFSTNTIPRLYSDGATGAVDMTILMRSTR